MSGEKPAGHVSKDPRPVADIGSYSLSLNAPKKRYEPDEIEQQLMAYAGYPDVQADLLSSLGKNTVSTSEVTERTTDVTARTETIADVVARTRYVVSSTPVKEAVARSVETLTTEVL